MSLRVCLDCTAAFAVGLPRCPQCGSERHAEEGQAVALGIQPGVPVVEEEHMPKITRHGGPSVPPVEGAETEGGEGVSAGEDSSNSSGTADSKSSTGARSSETHRSRARKTASRSSQARTDSSTARSTDGGPEAGTSATADADK